MVQKIHIFVHGAKNTYICTWCKNRLRKNMSTSKKDLNSNPQGENESFKSFVLAIEILQLNTEERDS